MDIIKEKSKEYRNALKYSLKNNKDEVGYAITRPTLGEDSTGISELHIYPEYQNKGYSKLLINNIIDDYNTDIVLRANPYKNRKLEKNQLEELYSKVGFRKENDGRMRYKKIIESNSK